MFESLDEQILKIVRVADNGERITALFNFSHNVHTVYEKVLSGVELLSGQAMASYVD